MVECLFPKTHREEDGPKTGQSRLNMAAQCPQKDWSRLREKKKQTMRAKGKQSDGQATAKAALSMQPRIGRLAKRIGQQAPIQSDRYWSSMGRETLARPSLHLRWWKRCCAKDLVRGAPSGEGRFCASSVLVLRAHKVLAVPFWLSPPCHPSLAPHQRLHSRVCARHQGTNGAPHHSMQALPCLVPVPLHLC